MKWYSFEKKMPLIGASILIAFRGEEEIYLSLIEFGSKERMKILDNLKKGSMEAEGMLVEWSQDDSSLTCDYDLTCAQYWAYPSSATLPE